MARLPRLRLFALTALLCLPVGCSDPQDDCVRHGQAGFEAHEPFDARARVRRVDCGFLSSVQNLAVGPDGSAWLRRTEFKDLEDNTFNSAPVKLLTHVGPGGEWRWERTLPDFVSHLAAHPSGEVTVLGWEKEADPTRLQVLRLEASGATVAERVLTNDTPVAGRLNFEAYPDGRLVRVEAPREGRYLTFLAAAAHGEDVYVLAGMDGLRLLRLDRTLRPVWSSVVTPSVVLREYNSEQLRAAGLPFANWVLAVDEGGHVHVAQPFLDVHRRAYVAALGREPEGPAGRSILLSRFDPGGTLLSARTVPTGNVDEVVGLVVEGGAWAVGARAQTLVTREDKRTEADLFFASGRWDAPADALVMRTRSLDNDDSPAAFVSCGQGRYCFAGHTGYLDLVTGRADVEGQGFLLAVDAQGEQQDLVLLQGQRDTEVTRAAVGPGGSVVFTFSTNQAANEGRVGDRFRYNEIWLGVLGGP